MEEFETLHEIVAAARRNLSPNDWDTLNGGAETETSLRRNRAAIEEIALRPRVLVDVRKVELGATVFGMRMRTPVCMAPVGRYRFGGGPPAVFRAAQAFGCPAMLSSVNQEADQDEIARSAPGDLRIHQIYVRGDARWLEAEVNRAVANGFRAICITVDTSVISRRERDIANRHLRGSPRGTPDLDFQAAFDWRGLEAVRKYCPVPLIVKGVDGVDDAKRLVEMGIEGIYVSNHGGRQVDHGVASIDALQEIVAELKGKATLIVDGGFYRGSDVVKALAMGADLVGLGRLHCWGLAAAGEAGVTRVLELLEIEMRMCLQLLGVTSVAELKPRHLAKARNVAAENLHGAFPLLAKHQSRDLR
ncbi:alpha-hydroxy acid oxidase [Ramlibacter sp.]|uniref:alpha-hydroxy acid oxidase n=1 Tax=Ramlibacter sp. TaxID=1917967 RepID=UPI003D0CBAB2